MLYVIKIGFERVNAKFFTNLDKNALIKVSIWVLHPLFRTQFLRAFSLRVLNAKRCFFLAFLTQKLVPSRVLNAIIFGIDEQCGFIFETALFTNCKIYIIFLRNDMSTTFLRQILSGRLLLIVIIGAKK